MAKMKTMQHPMNIGAKLVTITDTIGTMGDANIITIGFSTQQLPYNDWNKAFPAHSRKLLCEIFKKAFLTNGLIIEPTKIHDGLVFSVEEDPSMTITISDETGEDNPIIQDLYISYKINYSAITKNSIRLDSEEIAEFFDILKEFIIYNKCEEE